MFRLQLGRKTGQIKVFFGYGDTLVLRTGWGKLGATREPRPSHPLQPLLCHSRLLGALPFPSFGGSPPRQGKAPLFGMSVGVSVAGAAPSPCPCCPAAPLFQGRWGNRGPSGFVHFQPSHLTPCPSNSSATSSSSVAPQEASRPSPLPRAPTCCAPTCRGLRGLRWLLNILRGASMDKSGRSWHQCLAGVYSLVAGCRGSLGRGRDTGGGLCHAGQ